MTDLNRLSAHVAAGLIRARTISARDLMRACLDRIAERDGALYAFAHVDGALALAQAEAADAVLARDRNAVVGPLFGVPVAIKDVIDTADLPTEHGSPIFAGRRPEQDAACVAQLRQAGAIVIGKTATTELASLTPTVTCNPRAPGHTPGGSSSGSAAAVADFMTPLALGTQTAGSVIRPAAYCGLYGFKPTLGLISRRGVLLQSHTLDTVGVLARSLDDLALAVDCMADHDGADDVSFARARPHLARIAAQQPPTPLRIAFCRTPAWDYAEPATRAAMDALRAKLGAACVEVEWPAACADILEAQATIQLAENAHHYGALFDHHADALSAGMRERLTRGVAITARVYQDAVLRREGMMAALAPIFAGYDAILCPSAPGPAPEGLTATGNPIFNGLWTYLGVPAVTLPLFENNALPLGAQLVGARREDGRLLRTARALEALWRGVA